MATVKDLTKTIQDNVSYIEKTWPVWLGTPEAKSYTAQNYPDLMKHATTVFNDTGELITFLTSRFQYDEKFRESFNKMLKNDWDWYAYYIGWGMDKDDGGSDFALASLLELRSRISEIAIKGDLTQYSVVQKLNEHYNKIRSGKNLSEVPFCNVSGELGDPITLGIVVGLVTKVALFAMAAAVVLGIFVYLSEKEETKQKESETHRVLGELSEKTASQIESNKQSNIQKVLNDPNMTPDQKQDLIQEFNETALAQWETTYSQMQTKMQLSSLFSVLTPVLVVGALGTGIWYLYKKGGKEYIQKKFGGKHGSEQTD